jgi:putative transposase
MEHGILTIIGKYRSISNEERMRAASPTLQIPHLEWSFEMQNLDQFISSTYNRPIDNTALGRTLEHLALAPETCTTQNVRLSQKEGAQNAWYKHSEEQIIAIFKESEKGLATAELCRQHGISEQTLYRWKAKYGGMESSDAKRLKALEDENRKLKHVLAELTLDNRALKDVLSKNW